MGARQGPVYTAQNTGLPYLIVRSRAAVILGPQSTYRRLVIIIFSRRRVPRDADDPRTIARTGLSALVLAFLSSPTSLAAGFIENNNGCRFQIIRAL